MKKKIIFLIFSVFLAFLGSILIDRFLDYYLNRIGYYKAMVPNVTKIYDTDEFYVVDHISSQGLRNEEVKIPKPKDTFRILALGDSFTYGWGTSAEKNWVKLLEKGLTIKNKKTEIVNAGVPGAGLDEEIEICQAYYHFNSDAILIGFYTDDLYQAAVSDENPYSIKRTILSIWPTLTRIEKPIIFDTIWQKIKKGETVKLSNEWKSITSSVLQKAPMFLLNIDPLIRTDFINGKVFPGLALDLWSNQKFLDYFLNKDHFKKVIKSTEKRLNLFKTNCSNNLPLIVVYIPDLNLINTSDTENKIARLDFDTPMKRIVEKQGFSYISPLKEFRIGGCKDCYYKYDHHFTEIGNRKFADFIKPELQKFLDNLVNNSRNN